ncbi:hypothetical protein PAHAL_5G397700 [Panicum hallii]|uniref:Uncharacterized protein n=1 Tax=Panicum hallii TaxID=206008 RepID=A0A2T8IMP7_9POAL|nr:hypothetical protein PAHAL_5G397700 [Panicum hallii]
MDPVQTVLTAAVLVVDGECVARLAYSSPAPPSSTRHYKSSLLPSQLRSARPSDAPLISRRNPASPSGRAWLRPLLRKVK